MKHIFRTKLRDYNSLVLGERFLWSGGTVFHSKLNLSLNWSCHRLFAWKKMYNSDSSLRFYVESARDWRGNLI